MLLSEVKRTCRHESAIWRMRLEENGSSDVILIFFNSFIWISFIHSMSSKININFPALCPYCDFLMQNHNSFEAGFEINLDSYEENTTRICLTTSHHVLSGMHLWPARNLICISCEVPPVSRRTLQNYSSI